MEAVHEDILGAVKNMFPHAYDTDGALYSNPHVTGDRQRQDGEGSSRAASEGRRGGSQCQDRVWLREGRSVSHSRLDSNPTTTDMIFVDRFILRTHPIIVGAQ